MHAAHGLVDGVLLGALAARQPVQGLANVVYQRLVVQLTVALAVQFLQGLQLLDVGQPHVGGQVEVEGRYGLTAVHLVLGALHRYAGQHRRRLDALGRPRCAVTGNEAARQDVIQRVLNAGQRLRGVIVLVVYVQVVVLHGVAALVREQVVVDEGLGGLRRKLHHHARRRVGVHVGILARHVVRLDVDDVQKHVARLGLAGYRPLVAIGYVLRRHVLAARLHQLHLHHVLYLFHRHLAVAALRYVVRYLVQQAFVLAPVGVHHGLAYGSHNLLLVESNDASVSLYNCLYHLGYL